LMISVNSKISMNDDIKQSIASRARTLKRSCVRIYNIHNSKIIFKCRSK
ncbi:unnamed protein product, partial [Rotaria magnacalcarata]